MHVLEAWDHPDDKGVILGFGAAPHTACLELYAADANTDQAPPMVGIQFKVQDLKAFLSTVPKHITFEGPKDRPWGATYAYFKDPAGIDVVVFDGPTY